MLTANNETKINLLVVDSMRCKNPPMSGFGVRCLVSVETNAGCSMDKSYNSIQEYSNLKLCYDEPVYPRILRTHSK